jgi:pimeloyl-ACP methyl ester carboxylesterase
MIGLSNEAHVVAIDLPGIGESQNPPRSNDKTSLAGCVSRLIKSMGLSALTLVGHDIGGQIVYAYLHEYPGELQRAVIMNVAIPGIDPWNEVKHNPHIWYFAFHSVSESRSPIKPSRSLTIVCFAFVRK